MENYSLEKFNLIETQQFVSQYEYCVMICIQGNCRLSNTENSKLISAGQIAILAPQKKIQASNFLKITTEILFLRLPFALLKELSSDQTDLLKGFGFKAYNFEVVDAPHSIFMLLQNITRRLINIQNDNVQYAQDIFEKSLISSISVLILRACISQDKAFKSKQHSHFVIDDIFAYIKNNLSDTITLDKLASTFYISKAHISREFKRQCGQTVHKYITKARLEYSLELLLQGKHITEVYHISGFKDYNNFFRTFKQYYGNTPKAYIREQKTSLISPY